MTDGGKNMKILMVTPRYSPNISGGGEISCQLLVNEIAKYEHIDVVSFDGNKTQQTKVEDITVKRVTPISKSKTLICSQAYNILREEINNYDLFHTYNMTLMPVVGELTKKYRIPSLATLNGIVFSPSMSNYKIKYFSPKFYRNKIVMKSIKNIKHFTTISPYFKENWVKDGIEEDRITVIPNMIDPSFKVIENDRLDDMIRILFIGNYAKWRKLDVLLEAYSKLRYQKNIELVIVGKGWENTIKKYKMKNKVTYLGGIPYSQIADIYSTCDIFVYPTAEAKTTDRVLIEALQSKITVIATGNDYYSPIIRNERDGLLLYPMNPKILAEKIQMLVDDKKLRVKLAENGEKRVYEICSPSKIVKKYFCIYKKILEGQYEA